MQEYKLKRGFTPDPERIYAVLQECFPSEITRNGDRFETSYGAMLKISAWIEGKKLSVDTVSDTSVTDDELILKTNSAFRTFLYEATGYTAKERLKQAKKAVSGK
ncbi:MAG: DUF5611 family protein [Methanosarcinaceae archaeon]|nr:DUF5611 family protein [Methanosarcinaceae archaeon]MDD4498252.1 DUF5611 family protein [Methanosarcinaceae archaeon]